MKKFLEDLRRELTKRNVDPLEITEIIADHEEMIQTALADGLSEDEIASRFGDPAKVAEELAQESPTVSTERKDQEKFRLWKSFPVSEIELICDFHLISEDVTIQTIPQNEIRISYFLGEDRSKECPEGETLLSEYQITYKNGLLLVKAPKQSGFLFSRNRCCDLSLLVEIPGSVEISDFGFVTVSGDVEVLDLKAETFDLSTTSADVSLRNLKAETVKLNTVSGDIRLSGASLKTIDSSQVSGDMVLKDLHVETRMKTHTVSGDTTVLDSDGGECEMDSISGDIRGTEFYPRQVAFRSMSGDIYLTNKDPHRVQIVSQKTMSGEIHIR